MRKLLKLILVLGALSGIPSLMSCIVAVPSHEVMMEGSISGEVYVREEPPPPREEVIVGIAPGPDYVWVGGYWCWQRSHWYWVGGRWATRPHPHAIWVAGRWEPHPRGHVWISGHWR
jgi:hypothetical protein